MDVIDRIYEAAFVPHRWRETLGGLCARSGALQGSMLIFDRDAPPGAVGYNIPDSDFLEFQRVWSDSPAVRWALNERPSGFTTFGQNLPTEMLAADRAITMLYEQGLDDQAVSVQALGEGRALAFMFARRGIDGHFAAEDLAALDAMRPHIVRSGLVAARLGLERARSTVDTLARLGFAAAVIGRNGKVIAVNPLLETMPSVMVATAFGGIAIANHIADARFRAALARIGVGENGPQLSIPVRSDMNREPLIVHLLPVRGEAHDIFAGGHVLMVVAPVRRGATPAPELLHGLFDLTPAEARLTRELLTGGALPDIAARTGLSVHTVRIQLRAVMAKTGTHRQAELTHLLAGL